MDTCLRISELLKCATRKFDALEYALFGLRRKTIEEDNGP